MNSLTRRLLPAIMVLLLCASAPLAYSALLLEYKFNETGTTAESSGDINQALTMYATDKTTATDFHGAAGSGVSGSSFDRAFDNSSATRMGTGGSTADGARGDLKVTGAFDGLTSFTLQGWIMPTINVSGSAARLLERAKSGDNSHYLTFQVSKNTTAGNGRFLLQIGSQSVQSSNTLLLGGANSWVFFAVTYDFDSETSTGQVTFYAGSTSEAVVQIGTATL